MKSRQGFVSNSSTSSFCIYGTEIEFSDEDVKAFLLKGKSSDPDNFNKVIKEEITNCEPDDDCTEYENAIFAEWHETLTTILNLDQNTPSAAIAELKEIDDWCEIIRDICRCVYRYDYDQELLYLGKPWPSIGDDEVVGEWKAKIQAEIQKWVPGVECHTILDSYRS